MSFWSRIERRLEEFAGELYPDEFREKLGQAQQMLAEGDYLKAESALLALVGDRPDHAGALVYLGVARLHQGKSELALRAFDLALEQVRDMPEALIGRGDACLDLGEIDDAITAFRSAVSAARGESELLAEAYRGLGLSYRQSGNLDKAIRELRKAVAEASGDARIVAALGDALSADTGRSNDEAKRYLERLADRDGCPSVAWLALGRIAIDDEDYGRAIEYFIRVGDNESQPALLTQAYLGLGQAKLGLQELGGAEEALVLALAHQPRSAAALSTMAQLKEAQGMPEEAMGYYQRALNIEESSTPERIQTARQALALSLRSSDIATGVLLANRVLEDDAGDANALTARGLELYAKGNLPAAKATYEQALLSSENLETLLAIGALELARGQLESAGKYARRALRQAPTSPRAKELLAQCRAASLGVRLQADSSWYDLASATARLCTEHPELRDLIKESSNAIAEYDQPLLVAVMGEFSSGKSSFVNAFIGSEVAPTGVTPTTATINIVKYGRNRGARIVYRDNTSREVEGAKPIQSVLRAIDDAEARRVAHVEILMPIDVLERVNIVDTPGLNSILPEHEAVARAFLKRADAVVWLFTGNQAGKSTEKKALDSIAEHGVRVLGVLNKVDQLSDQQVKELISYVSGELGDRVEACVPISAKRAIEKQPDSGWEELRNELEERFFQHARELKKQALNRRLEVILDSAKQRANKGLDSQSARSEALRTTARRAQESMIRFVDQVVEHERSTISRDVGLLYRSAAREVLELVRPRKLPFGSHTAAQADRDYLLGLLDSGYEKVLWSSRFRSQESLQDMAQELLEPIAQLLDHSSHELSELVSEGLRLVEAEVFHSCLSYLRGFLRGGFVDHFFNVELGKLQLSEDAVYHALFRASPEIDAEISLPLASAGGRLLGDLASRLEDLANLAEVEAFEMDAGLQQAVSSLSDHRAALATQFEDEAL